MRRIASLATKLAFIFLLALDAGLFAADRGTAAEAKAMLLDAVAHYKAVGRKQALADFTAKKPPFGDRDLYVVCFNSERIVVANGGFPGHIGTPADVVVDVHGQGMGTAARRLFPLAGKQLCNSAGLILLPAISCQRPCSSPRPATTCAASVLMSRSSNPRQGEGTGIAAITVPRSSYRSLRGSERCRRDCTH